MDVKELQRALGTPDDGAWGPASRAALKAAFTNVQAPAATEDQLRDVAHQLGASLKQIKAVAMVEASGSGFDIKGRPKMRFERHVFRRETNGRFGTTVFSAPTVDWGVFDSWDRLAAACGADPEAAFASASWGKFQVMGYNAGKFGFDSSFAMAKSTVADEKAHYDLFAKFVLANGLGPALRKLSTNPVDCRDFAKGYNGSAYAKDGYHLHLAQAMQ